MHWLLMRLLWFLRVGVFGTRPDRLVEQTDGIASSDVVCNTIGFRPSVRRKAELVVMHGEHLLSL